MNRINYVGGMCKQERNFMLQCCAMCTLVVNVKWLSGVEPVTEKQTCIGLQGGLDNVV